MRVCRFRFDRVASLTWCRYTVSFIGTMLDSANKISFAFIKQISLEGCTFKRLYSSKSAESFFQECRTPQHQQRQALLDQQYLYLENLERFLAVRMYSINEFCYHQERSDY